MKDNGRFFKSYYDLMSASGFVGNNGELVKLTLTEKNIYCLMLSRYDYFVREKGGTYYDTQESIGCALDIDRRTVLQKLKVFMKHGVIVGEKKKVGNYLNWSYTAINPMKLWWANGQQGSVEIATAQEGKSTSKPKVVESSPLELDVPEWDLY